MSDKKVLQNPNDIQVAYYDSYDDYYVPVAENAPESKAARAQHFRRMLAMCSKIVAGNLALGMFYTALAFPGAYMHGLVVGNRLSDELILAGCIGAGLVGFTNMLVYSTLISERKNPAYALLVGAEIYDRCFIEGIPAAMRACKNRVQAMMRNRNNVNVK